MNKKVIGVILVIAGIALAVWGYDVYESAGSKITRALSGDTPVEAWIGMIAGGVCIIFGIRQLK